MSKTRPRPILRVRNKFTVNRIAMHVLELLDRLFMVPDIEVIVATLPESYVTRFLEFSRYLLLQHLQDNGELEIAGFADQQMHVFGHDNVTRYNEAVLLPHLFQLLLEDAISGSRFKQRLPSITTEGKKVEIASVLIVD